MSPTVKAPVWWPLVRLLLALAFIGGGLWSAGSLWSGGATLMPLLVVAGMLGAFAGLYPSELDREGARRD